MLLLAFDGVSPLQLNAAPYPETTHFSEVFGPGGKPDLVYLVLGPFALRHLLLGRGERRDPSLPGLFIRVVPQTGRFRRVKPGFLQTRACCGPLSSGNHLSEVLTEVIKYCVLVNRQPSFGAEPGTSFYGTEIEALSRRGPGRRCGVYTNSPSVETKDPVEMPSAWFKTEYVQRAFPVKPTAVVISPDLCDLCYFVLFGVESRLGQHFEHSVRFIYSYLVVYFCLCSRGDKNDRHIHACRGKQRKIAQRALLKTSEDEQDGWSSAEPCIAGCCCGLKYGHRGRMQGTPWPLLASRHRRD